MVHRTDSRPRRSKLSLETLESRNVLATVIAVDTFVDVIDENDGVTSLREAILQANASSDAFEIQLAAGTYALSIPPASAAESNASAGDLDVFGTVSILGSPEGGTVIDASPLIEANTGFGDRIFEVISTADVALHHLTLTGGRTRTTITGVGGAVRTLAANC